MKTFKKILRKFFKPKIKTDKKINLDNKIYLTLTLVNYLIILILIKVKYLEDLILNKKQIITVHTMKNILKKLKNKKLNILEIGCYMGSSAAFLSYLKMLNYTVWI